MQPNFETGQRLLINRVAYWRVDGTAFEGLIRAD
jgi:signal peptidase I